MQRTTVMLPHDLKLRASEQARKLGLSLGELIRQSLVQLLSASSNNERDPFFADSAVFNGNVPKDFARNHDAHLYGDPE